MKTFDYNKIKPIESNCGTIKEGLLEDIGFSRASMRKGFSTAHFHKKLTEYYLVLEGDGFFRIKTKNGLKEIELRPGVVVKIEPGEIHQTKTPEKLVVEVVTHPAWIESDEFPAKENLFK
jgi:mannose-6-phosphate isomerase-like protein (cupin superfamily)